MALNRPLTGVEQQLLDRNATLAVHIGHLQHDIHIREGHAEKAWGRCEHSSCVRTREVLHGNETKAGDVPALRGRL